MSTVSIIKKPDLGHDFYCGFLGGALTGPLIAGFEVMKVKLQETAIECSRKGLAQKQTHKVIFDNFRSLPWWRSWLKTSIFSVPQFSFNYGMVCALEFSVNARIKKQFGDLSGIIPSAFTGALFLTPAEHLMFRAGLSGQNFRKAFTDITKRSYGDLFIGMRSMFVREAVFVFNLFFAGLLFGRWLENQVSNNSGEKDDQFWRNLGRLSLGIPLTALTHPFDTASRVMQIEFHKNPSIQPTLMNVFRNLTLRELFWAGLPPRLILAPVGGTLATHIYEKKKEEILKSY